MDRRILRMVREDLRRKMVLVAGPRQCGKTTLANAIVRGAKGHYYSWDRDEDRRALRHHQLDAAAPLWAFDEIHKYSRWRNWLKGVVDEHHPSRQILVTGSARLDVYGRGGDSLQGRYLFHRLHPLTFSELSGSRDVPALEDIPSLSRSPGRNADELLTSLLDLGGFPEPLLSDDRKFAARWRLGYGARLVREEVRDLEHVKQLDLMEMLFDRLPAVVGSPLSLNSLREDLEVSFDAVKRWLAILENLYACFRLSPYGPPRIKAVKKEQKLYLWDWSRIEEIGPKIENLVAFHLLRLTHWMADTEGEKAELRFLRDTLGREADFVVLRKGKPWMLIEVKHAETSLSPHLRYFAERLSVPYVFQLSWQAKSDIVLPSIEGSKVRLTSIARFLANLP